MKIVFLSRFYAIYQVCQPTGVRQLTSRYRHATNNRSRKKKTKEEKKKRKGKIRKKEEICKGGCRSLERKRSYGFILVETKKGPYIDGIDRSMYR